LDEVLSEWLPQALGCELSRSAIRRLVMVGVVLVDGRALCRPGQGLRAGQRLEARVSLERLAKGDRDKPFVLTPRHVLFEDDWLLAVAKPAALPFHATADPSRPSLVDAVRRFLSAREAQGRGAEPYVGVHQRLDRDTTGVALFSKRREANAGLAAAFEARRAVKIYHALTTRPLPLPPREWTVSDRLGTVGRGRAARAGRVEEGGALARTDFRVVSVLARGLLVEARPRTGRKHQIRAHLAGCGLAILGDERFGDASRGSVTMPRLMLHAARLELVHPVLGRPLVIGCPYPEDFKKALAALDREVP
jgi:23S rRNA pseudouridine1911/1915/1917 synthase